ncbi:MAG: hypothetical protein ACTINL_06590, partial [Serratia proteamaculans]
PTPSSLILSAVNKPNFGASITAIPPGFTSDDPTTIFQTVSRVKTAYSQGLFVTCPRPMLKKMQN